jgi:hypothetical protein
MSDTISLQDRIRTFSDGVLNINNIEPSDHGSYVCIISILNSTTIRSKPAIITVKCEFIIFIFIANIKKKLIIRSSYSIVSSSSKQFNIDSRFIRYMSMFIGCISTYSICLLVSRWKIYSYRIKK